MPALILKQLDGQKRELRFEGHAAPHGRPRVGPVANIALRMRESETFVDGTNVPVRHTFGYRFEPLEFKGRFNDRYSYNGFAEQMAVAARSFVAEQRPVRLSWSGETDTPNQILCEGSITEFDSAIESPHEIAWRLLFRVDTDLQLDKATVPSFEDREPRDYTNEMLLYLTELQEAAAGMPLKLSVSDIMNGLISMVASLVSTVANIAEEISSFEKATFAATNRFISVLGQLKTAAIKLRDTVDAFKVDYAIASRHANDRLSLFTGQTSITDSSISIIKAAVRAERAARAAQQGKVLAVATANGGDTFETLSQRYYGAQTRAADIREANGVQDGGAPIAGQLYLIPT